MYISYDYYRIFYYVASCGSVSRAAAELRNNQPNLTRAIKNLETELGCALFLRTNRGMKLTPEGERLFAHIRVAFQQIERGETELQELRELRRGSVTIAASEIALRSMLLPVLQEFRRLHPDITLKISNHTTPQAIEALLPVTDQFLVDIKFLDPALHKRHLGADNRAILENFEHLLARDADVLVRTPLIPGYTATDENLRAIARYLRRVAPHTPWELLNFNPLCRGKYAALEQDYPVSGGSLTQAELQRFYDILEQEGITNIVKE